MKRFTPLQCSLMTVLACLLFVLLHADFPPQSEAGVGSAGELSIPEITPLGPAQLKRLRRLVREDSEAASLVQEIREQAEPLLDIEPRPIRVLHYEGLVNTNPKRIKTVEHLSQIKDAATLFRYWQATGSEEAAATLRRLIAAWTDVYVPTGNDVNDNKMYSLLVAYEALRDTFPADQRERIDGWVQRVGELHEKAVRKAKRFTNRYTKSVRLLALSGMILDRSEWIEQAEAGIRRFVSESLYGDGSSYDLKHRDTLTYHSSALRPPMELAMLLGERGKELYTWTNKRGGSLKKSVDYVVPYAMGEKIHREWVHTRVDLDRRRAAAGIEKYRTGRLYEPKSALELMTQASYFDPTLRRVVVHLEPSDAERFPTWRMLLNEAARAEPAEPAESPNQ